MITQNSPKFGDTTYFDGVEFVIEATDYEVHSLWEKYHYRPEVGSVYIETWEDIAMGHGITLASMGNMPICVSVRYSILNGHKVMFYTATSEVVNHRIIGKWIEHHTSHLRKNGRMLRCDPMNFHHCLHYVLPSPAPTWSEQKRKKC
jgi:hypothetical protein